MNGKQVVVGVCGGVAAYKAVEVCRRLGDLGARVVPVMTRAAHRFVGATTLSAVCGNPVQDSLWDGPNPIPHTRLGQNTDLVVVVPATARLIGMYANGISADLLTATLIATRAPVIVCPAMHTEMWEHPAVQHNIGTLRDRGVRIVGPEPGPLAGGDIGYGRLADPASIVAACVDVLAPRPLAGRTVIVSAGGTREPIDAVRVVANRSTGKQGHAIAEAARRAGARVVLVTTAEQLPTPFGVERVDVETAEQMRDAIVALWGDADACVMTAAVADFRPRPVSDGKWKKDQGPPPIVLEPTPDILAGLGATKRPGQVLVGFAAETSELEKNATGKLARKNLDLIVANDVTVPGAGFGVDTNTVTVFRADGSRRSAQGSKQHVATVVVAELVAAFNR